MADVGKNLIDMLNGVRDGTVSIEKATAALSGYHDALAGLNGMMQKSTKASEAYNKAKKALIESTLQAGKIDADAVRKVKALGDAYQKEQALLEKLNKSLDENVRSHKSLRSAVSQTRNEGLKFLGFLGASTISFGNAKKILLEYNQSLFDLSRIQQTSGRGMKDLEDAFDMVREKTTMSKREFVDFAKVMSQGYQGIAPSIKGIAEFSVALQRAFGPDINTAKEAAKSFLSIMEKYPAQFHLLNKVMKDAQIGKFTAESKQQQAILMNSLRLQGASVQQMRQVLQATTKSTKAQDEQLKSNRAVARVGQKTEDVMLKAGQSMEKSFTAAAGKAGDLLDSLEKMPGAINAITAALVMMNATNALGGIGGNIIGSPMGKGIGRMIRGMGTSSAPAAGAMRGISGGVVRGVGAGAVAGIGTAVMAVHDYRSTKKRALEEGVGVTAAKKAGVQKAGYGAAGAVIGGAIGTLVGGPIGTMAGAAIGGYVGGAFGKGQADKTIEEAQKKITKEKEKQAKLEEKHQQNLDNIAIALQAQIKNLEYALKIQEAIQSSLKSQIESYMEMGSSVGLEEAFDNYLKSIQKTKKEQRDFFQEAFSDTGLLARTLSDIGVDLSGIVDFDSIKDLPLQDLVKELEGAADKVREKVPVLKMERGLEEKEQERDELLKERQANPDGFESDTEGAKKLAKVTEEIQSIMAEVQSVEDQTREIEEQRVAALKTIAEEAKAGAMQFAKQFELQEKFNSSMAERLQMEKELMEAAQFGLGASISMTQKQVDLAYEMMSLSKQEAENTKKSVKTELEKAGASASVADQMGEQLMNAKTLNGLQDMLTNKFGVEEGLHAGIIQAWKSRNELEVKSMQYQKQIYDLTKEMREGYLGAIREMAIGAGEFEKIIGTHEMGVTQLMDQVNKFTESGDKNMLNTMTLGGMQTSEQTASGLGAEVAGRYTASGAQFKNQNMTAAENRRIYGYEESVRDAQNQNLEGRVGTAVGGSQVNDTANALRDALPTTSAPGGEALRVVDVGNRGSAQGQFNGVNPGTIPQGTGGRSGNFGTYEKQNPADVTAFSYLTSRFGFAPQPADPGPLADFWLGNGNKMPSVEELGIARNVDNSRYKANKNKLLWEAHDTLGENAMDALNGASFLNMPDLQDSDRDFINSELLKVMEQFEEGSPEEKQMLKYIADLTNMSKQHFGKMEAYEKAMQGDTDGDGFGNGYVGASKITELSGGGRLIFGLDGLGRTGINEGYEEAQEVQEKPQEAEEKTKPTKPEMTPEEKAEKEKDKALDKMHKKDSKLFNLLMKKGQSYADFGDMAGFMTGIDDLKENGFSAKSEAMRRGSMEALGEEDGGISYFGGLIKDLQKDKKTQSVKAFDEMMGGLSEEEQMEIKLGLLRASANQEDKKQRIKSNQVYQQLFPNGITEEQIPQVAQALSGSVLNDEGQYGALGQEQRFTSNPKLQSAINAEALLSEYHGAKTDEDRYNAVFGSFMGGEDVRKYFNEKMFQHIDEKNEGIAPSSVEQARARLLDAGYGSQDIDKKKLDVQMYERAEKKRQEEEAKRQKEETEIKEKETKAERANSLQDALRGISPAGTESGISDQQMIMGAMGGFSLNKPGGEFLAFGMEQINPYLNADMSVSSGEKIKSGQEYEEKLADITRREKIIKEKREQAAAAKESIAILNMDKNEASQNAAKLNEELNRESDGYRPMQKISGEMENEGEWKERIGQEKYDKIKAIQAKIQQEKTVYDSAEREIASKQEQEEKLLIGAGRMEVYTKKDREELTGIKYSSPDLAEAYALANMRKNKPEKETDINAIKVKELEEKYSKDVIDSAKALQEGNVSEDDFKRSLATSGNAAWMEDKETQERLRQTQKVAYHSGVDLRKNKDGPQAGTLKEASDGMKTSGAQTMSEGMRRAGVAEADIKAAEQMYNSPEAKAGREALGLDAGDAVGAGGGGSAVIVIKLDSSLEGDIEEMRGLQIELQQGVSSNGN